MTENQAAPIRQDPGIELSQLRHDHPEYEIQLRATEMWEAVSHPTAGQTVVHCAGSLDELRAKLDDDAP